MIRDCLSILTQRGFKEATRIQGLGIACIGAIFPSMD